MTSPEAESVGARSLDEISRPLRVVRRLGWGIGDQVLSSFTNFLLGLLVARGVDARDLGAFSLAFATFTLSVGAVRAIAGELLIVRHTAVSVDRWRHGVKRAAGTALVSGLGVGASAVIAGVALGGSLRAVLIIIGVFLPFLLIQDVWRFAFFALGTGRAAFVNDLTWTIGVIAAFMLSGESGRSSVAWLTFVWASAGSFASLVGLLQLRLLPSGPKPSIRWLRHNSDLASRFFAEFGLATGTSNLLLFGMGSVMGLAELGRLRAGQITLSPLNVVFSGVALVATPEGVLFLRESPMRLVAWCRWVALGLSLAPFAWGAVLLLLPTETGEFMLGPNWHAARSVLVPLSIASATFGVAFGAYAGLRSLAAARRSVRAKSFNALVTIPLVLAGAAIGGARGAAWGSVVAGCVGIAIAWWQLNVALREYSDANPDRIDRQTHQTSPTDAPDVRET